MDKETSWSARVCLAWPLCAQGCLVEGPGLHVHVPACVVEGLVSTGVFRPVCETEERDFSMSLSRADPSWLEVPGTRSQVSLLSTQRWGYHGEPPRSLSPPSDHDPEDTFPESEVNGDVTEM